ncbi:glutamate ABC transporter substrate-binding protein [Corynebacterium sp. TAE3-ERU12]|nr:glutamate ABC transporter substrate-binding protein [Corynebacterium sp. TAE3-ERU12]
MVVAAGVLLTGCAPSSGPANDPFSGNIAKVQGDVPLPPDAKYEPANSRPLQSQDEFVPGTLPPGPGTAADRVPNIVERGRIIIGVDPSLNLLAFRDPNGQLTGFEVGLAREIARDIFGDPDAVDFRYVNSTERISALEEGRVDAVIRTMTVTSDRSQQVGFSAPYLEPSAGLLTTQEASISSTADLGGRRVCVAFRSTSEDVARATAPDSTLLLVNNWGDCLVALQQHQAEAILGDDFILAGIKAQDPGTVIVQRDLTAESYAVATGLKDFGLQRQVNATLERIRADGTWQALYNQWLGPYLKDGVQPTPNYVAREEAEQ